MAKTFYISKEALDKMVADLDEMKSVKRPELSKQIATAREFGDLKENAEYHAAKEKLALLEERIAKLEEKVHLARVIDPKKISNEQVSLYTTVTLKDLNRNQTVKYTLVSQEESDFRAFKISVDSPVGKALLGKKAGDKVDIKVPAGVMKYEVLEISV